MDVEEQLFDRIEDYLRGKMSTAESLAFEQEIAAKPTLAEQVERQRFELMSLEYLLEEDLTAKMAEWAKEPNKASKASPKQLYHSIWVWIALIAILLSILVIYLNKSKGDSPLEQPQEQRSNELEELVPIDTIQLDTTRAIANDTPSDSGPQNSTANDKAEQTKTERELDYGQLALTLYEQQLPSHLQGGGIRQGNEQAGDSSVMIRGVREFREGNFAAAIMSLNQIDSTKESGAFSAAQEYLAHANFQVGQHEVAAGIFRKMRDRSSVRVRERIEGYLMLSLLPNYQSHRREVDKLIQEISEDKSHRFNAQAEDLRRTFNN